MNYNDYYSYQELKKMKNALNKLKFKGRLQTNPIMRNMQVLQNFNSVKKNERINKRIKGNELKKRTLKICNIKD